jgi:hypothetical protein
MTKEDDFFAGFDPPVLKIDPIGPTAELKAEIAQLQAHNRYLTAALTEISSLPLIVAGATALGIARTALVPRPAGEKQNREHVAWLRYKKRGGSDEPTIVLCDSDDSGAFKVYR